MAKDVLPALPMPQGQTASDYPEELPRNRFWWKAAAALVLLAILSAAGTVAYRRWEPARLAGKARAYLAKGDVSNALLAARRALQINPTSEPASRVMAEVADKLQVTDVLDWRQRVAELNPGSTEDALAWASTALRMRQPKAAEQALAAVPEAERNTARYHAAAGAAAINTGQVHQAATHFAKAVELEPGNETYRYNLALLQLQSPDAATREAGSKSIDLLARGGRVELFAKRAVVTRLTGENSLEEALRTSTEIQRLPSVEFNDRMVHLDLLQRLGRPEVTTVLAQVQESSRAERPENVGALANWMRITGRNEEALRWLDSLDPKSASHGRIGIARAECLIAAKDWPGLRAAMEKGAWAELDPMRLAYLARALHESGDTLGARTRWKAAVTAAARARPQLMQLALMASRWEWASELRDTLWAAADAPAPGWALQMLHRSYLADGDTAGLLRVAEKNLAIDPASKPASNNVALLSLLLGRQTDRARETARALHTAAPADPGFASTYALALHLAGRSAEALEIMRQLPETALSDPSVAAYHGVLLSATGARDEAQKFFELAKGAPLLPEERALVANAGGASPR